MLPALLLSLPLLTATTSLAAPTHNARFNQPPAPVDLPLRPLSHRASHPDPEVRAAYARDELITARIKYARALDEDGHARLERDLEFVRRSNERRAMRAAEAKAKRQVGPQGVPSASASASSDAEPGETATGGSESSNATASGISLTDYNRDQGYATPVYVGTPAQEFLVVADTGSQDFVLFGRNCDGCEGHPMFDDTRSSTFEATQTTMYEAYGTGNASGIWALDRVEMGGYYVNDQPIALVQEGSVATYMGSELSGIMGLGVPSYSLLGPEGPVMEAPPMFWMTVSDEVWTDKQFGVYLERLNTDPSSYNLGSGNLVEQHQTNAGILTLGGLNTSLFTGEMHYMDANTTYWWQLPLESFTANGKKFNARSAATVIDTGSTAIMMPEAAVNAFHAQIPGAELADDDGTWVIPCDTNTTASFSFDGIDYPVQTADLLRGSLGGQYADLCLSNVGVGPWLLGAAFMKNVYTAFRLDPSPQIGFAQLSDSIVQNGKTGSIDGAIVSSNTGAGSDIGSDGSSSSASALGVSSVALTLGLAASLLL